MENRNLGLIPKKVGHDLVIESLGHLKMGTHPIFWGESFGVRLEKLRSSVLPKKVGRCWVKRW